MSLNSIFGLEGRVALVTGSGRGLGRAAALGLAEAGADVVLLSRTSSELEAVADEVRTTGRKVMSIVVDLSRPDELEQVVGPVVGEWGRLDILVNNAGVAAPEVLEDITCTNYRLQMAVNLEAPMALCRRAVKQMKTQGSGKIVNVVSLAAQLGTVGHSAYAVSKAGLASFSRTLAVELAQDGYDIQVNCLVPGWFNTGMSRSAGVANDAVGTGEGGDASRSAGVLARIPMGRNAQPDEIKGAIIFLCSAASSYVTAQNIYVDGGWLNAGV